MCECGMLKNSLRGSLVGAYGCQYATFQQPESQRDKRTAAANYNELMCY